jgi:toxin ParE1/3/4
MARYVLSRLASRDLDAVADYTLENFGLIQADKYAEGLKQCFEGLVQFNMRGRAVDELSPGLRAEAYQSHIIFYQIVDADIVIVRILHASQDARRHL